ncbi:hypothetical protein [Nocardioides sp.]|uniref:hypothetical protein n=1 Tax=Nocardioides sp. TaxID=35761 RepID=UPI002B26E3F5|nr:hypothetical protein [Nocardioides sp.]
MSTRPAIALDPTRSVVDQLRERVAAMERRPARESIATLPALAEVAPLTAGSTYGVDSATLALAMAAGASQAGEWVGFAGWSDFGVEAAAGLGIELSRTVLVPDLGEHWLEVTAALIDVLRVVVIRPPAVVDARAAEKLESRLRTRSGALVVWGQWPRCEARLSLEHSRWSGPQSGAGWLGERSVSVVVRRGERVVQRADLTVAAGLELVVPSPTSLRRAVT